MERFTVKKITIDGKPLGNSPIVLQDKDGQWVQEGNAHPIANDKVQALLDKLSGNRIQEFLIGSAIPSGEKDGLTIKLANEKGETQRELAFWKNGGKLYARDLASKRKEAFRVDIAVQEALPWTRDFFERKEVPPPVPVAGKPGAPGMPPGMPGAPGMPPGMPGAPGMPPEMPGAPGMPPGMHGAPGMPPGMHGAPGIPPGMPGAPPEPGKPLVPQPPQKK